MIIKEIRAFSPEDPRFLISLLLRVALVLYNWVSLSGHRPPQLIGFTRLNCPELNWRSHILILILPLSNNSNSIRQHKIICYNHHGLLVFNHGLQWFTVHHRFTGQQGSFNFIVHHDIIWHNQRCFYFKSIPSPNWKMAISVKMGHIEVFKIQRFEIIYLSQKLEWTNKV